MSIRTYIADVLTGKVVSIDSPSGEQSGLVVATRDLKKYTNKNEFFGSTTFGVDMNQNINYGSTPENIHNGTDNAYWTASVVTGATAGWDFASTGQAQDGTKSIDETSAANNDVIQVERGGGLLAMNNYDALSGYVYITAWAQTGTKHIVATGWNTATGAVGSSINVDDYIDTTKIDDWQKFTVPLSAMGLVGQSIDSFRIQVVGNPTPKLFMDVLRIEEIGTGTAIYEIRPVSGTWFHVHSIKISIGDDYTPIQPVAGTTENAVIPRIPPNGLLGVSALTNGLTFRRIQDDKTEQSFNARQTQDWLQIPNAHIDNIISTSSSVFYTIKVDYAEQETLKSEQNDLLQITVSDNLSGLTHLRMMASGGEEKRPLN